MAGSITYRNYTSDSGTTYTVKVDKSNASATVTGGTGALLPVRTANSAALPRGSYMRYANAYDKTNPLIKRRFYIGTSANYIAANAPGATISAEDFPGGDDAAGVAKTWIISSLRGEKARIIPDFSSPDTGETDGTTTE